MKRSFSIICLCLCFSIIVLFYTHHAFASSDVTMRATARDGYVRLVLRGLTTYEMRRDNKGYILITSDMDAQIDVNTVDFKPFPHVRGVDVVQENPLSLRVDVPKSSVVRDVKIGNRVIFDIYPPADADALRRFIAKGQKNNKKIKKSDVDIKTEKQVKEIKKEVSEAKKDIIKKATDNIEIALIPENTAKLRIPAKVMKGDTVSDDTAKKPVKLESEKLNKQKTDHHGVEKSIADAIEETAHVFSIRATNTVGVAAFVDYGMLWFVVDDDTSYVVPSLSSPDPSLFTAFEKMPIDGAASYRGILPDLNFKMQAKGGGLIWNLVLGEDVKQPSAFEVMRDFSREASGRLVFPVKDVGKILTLKDPMTGQDITVVTFKTTYNKIIEQQAYPLFDILYAPIGMAVRAKVDDLVIKKTGRGIEIYRKSRGLGLSRESDITAAHVFMRQLSDNKADHEHAGQHNTEKNHDDSHGLYKFNRWKAKDEKDMRERERILLARLHDKDNAQRVEDLLSLGKMMVAHGRGAEALGYFNFAALELPPIEESPAFRALRGVAYALDWKNEDALDDLLHPDLTAQDDVMFWKSFVLANLGDWDQAIDVLPTAYNAIQSYPHEILNRLALTLAEVNLRAGRVKQAEELMSVVTHYKKHLSDPQKAALKYLRGEASRQKGDHKNAISLWTALTQDKDDLYRTKAGLALTVLLSQDKQIDPDEAIDRLERLRYAWRGDSLEAQVNYWLGDAYFRSKKFIKGLSIMRDATTFAETQSLAQRITGYMQRTFVDLYLSDALKDVSAVDAVALYDQFSELTPAGAQGNKMVQMLAEHLVRADLLERAAKLLRYQVDHRLDGDEKARIATRLAQITLMDRQPQKTMDALAKAEQALLRMSDRDAIQNHEDNIALLKVRAYAQNKEFSKALRALELIPETAATHRLRANIAWQAGFWDEAADALSRIITDENIADGQQISLQQSEMILNRAIALNLDNDRVALANLRKKHLEKMRATPKINQFELVTRPSRSGALASRETLMSVVAEVDLFQEFLDTYRGN